MRPGRTEKPTREGFGRREFPLWVSRIPAPGSTLVAAGDETPRFDVGGGEYITGFDEGKE